MDWEYDVENEAWMCANGLNCGAVYSLLGGKIYRAIAFVGGKPDFLGGFPSLEEVQKAAESKIAPT